MEITISQVESRAPVTVLRIKGKIDVTTHAQLEQQAREAHAAGMKNLLIDLSEVAYISSAGLQVLHRLFLLLRTDTPAERDEAMWQGIRAGTFKSPHLKLLKPSPGVMEVLTLVGYDTFIEIHDDYLQAIASFGA
jgi:anti-anti-sigma regulatory factor